MNKLKKLIILLLIFNVDCVLALNHDGNVVGTVVAPSKGTSSSSSSCPTGAYYMGGQDPKQGGKNYLLGLRVSFYDENGKQVGNTVDVWNKNKIYSSRTWKAVSDTDSNAKLAANNGFEYYSIGINHAYGLPSRIDYYNKTVNFKLTGSTYYYYFDKTATGYQFMYTADAAAAMKEYFTTSSVVQRYMNIAKVTGIDSRNPDYTIVLEVLVRVDACGDGPYGGVYTASDLGNVVRYYWNIINYNLRCNVVKYLSLEKDDNIGDINFVKPDLSKKRCGWLQGNYTTDEVTISNLGVGMGFVHGREVCGDKCSSTQYKIVYHTIELTSPFIGLDGQKRVLDEKSNWYGKEDTINANVYQGKPIYTVTLTPSKIKEIRKTNKEIDYSNIAKKYGSEDTFESSEFKKSFGL